MIGDRGLSDKAADVKLFAAFGGGPGSLHDYFGNDAEAKKGGEHAAPGAIVL